jgi:hypothetical protein
MVLDGCRSTCQTRSLLDPIDESERAAVLYQKNDPTYVELVIAPPVSSFSFEMLGWVPFIPAVEGIMPMLSENKLCIAPCDSRLTITDK